MSTIVEQIRKDILTARKAKDQRTVGILSFALGELTANPVIVDGEKTFPDGNSIASLKKIIKNVQENLKVAEGYSAVEFINEIALYDAYLPKQLTEQELNIIIQVLAVDSQMNMGQIMKYMKEKHDGMYDGKLASAIAKKFIG